MQIHMRRLVEVTKDIDGFKVKKHNNFTINIKGGLCNGSGKRILQICYC